MKRFDITPTSFRVADFVGWQREGTLELNPSFQRRSVWRAGARSYFVDTLARGLPVPLIFIRERIDLASQAVIRDVVDGQQRLRTVIGFVDESLIAQFDTDKDRFVIAREHNAALAGKPFKELPEGTRRDILGYRFSVQILPPEVEDRDVLQIFARLNSTGTRLNSQELRNAAWFGEFKTEMYALAYAELERWLKWRVFAEDQISRMSEVELVSDLVINMMQGITGKSQALIGRYYKRFDASFPDSIEVGRRFAQVMNAIDQVYGPAIHRGSLRRQMHFFTVFAYFYDRMFGLGSSLERRRARPLPAALRTRLTEVDRRFSEGPLPIEVLEAVSGAATDLGRRRTRFDFLAAICDGQEG